MPALRRFFSSRPAVFLGRISYSLYLVHWSIAMLLGRLVGAPGSAPAAVLFFAAVAVVSCASRRSAGAGSSSLRFARATRCSR